MIGFLSGQVLFSDGKEAVIQAANGVGYQIYCYHILPEGEMASLFISHVVRENSEELFSFKSLREKKLFELLTTVKGVGPKSAYGIVSQISLPEIITAIQSDDKKVLTRVSGVGAKAASQMILDLQKKISKILIFSEDPVIHASFMKTPLSIDSESLDDHSQGVSVEPQESQDVEPVRAPHEAQAILNDTLLACQNLGFHDDQVVPLAQKILKENDIKKPEQLVHLVLKEI